MENLKEGINYIGEKWNAATSASSYEGNKEVATDSNQPVGQRADAAKDAVGDKFEQKQHDTKQEKRYCSFFLGM